MKKLDTLFASMTLCMGLACPLFLTSCSDDDPADEPTVEAAAKSIEGIYTGDMSCTVMGSESTFEDMTYTINATGDNTADITVSSFGNPPMQVPDITVTGVPVSGSNGVYTIESTKYSGSLSGNKEYSGTIQGSFADNTLTIDLNLQYGAMPQPMICKFVATKK